MMLRRNIAIGVYNLASLIQAVPSRKRASGTSLLYYAPVSTETAPRASSRSYTTRRNAFGSMGAERVQAEPRIQAGSSAAPKGRLSQ
jgi:hypothetical protein